MSSTHIMITTVSAYSVVHALRMQSSMRKTPGHQDGMCLVSIVVASLSKLYDDLIYTASLISIVSKISLSTWTSVNQRCTHKGETPDLGFLGFKIPKGFSETFSDFLDWEGFFRFFWISVLFWNVLDLYGFKQIFVDFFHKQCFLLQPSLFYYGEHH